jgi:hypothetical protein
VNREHGVMGFLCAKTRVGCESVLYELHRRGVVVEDLDSLRETGTSNNESAISHHRCEFNSPRCAVGHGYGLGIATAEVLRELDLLLNFINGNYEMLLGRIDRISVHRRIPSRIFSQHI